MRALLTFLFPHRWQGQLAAAKHLLASDGPAPPGTGTRTDAWLASPAWEVRNVAVKLIAHLHDEARYDRLLEKATDRSESGIVRRNAVEAIGRLGLATDAARTALTSAVFDRYWEVRGEAARALATLFPPDACLEHKLLEVLYGTHTPRRRIREENFEVCMACARGLGYLGVSRAGFEALAELARNDAWLVRSQAAVGLAHFAARLPEHFPEARETLRKLDRLSEGAVSYFVHRDVLSQALRAVHRGPDAIDPGQLAPLYLNPRAGWNHVRR